MELLTRKNICLIPTDKYLPLIYDFIRINSQKPDVLVEKTGLEINIRNAKIVY